METEHYKLDWLDFRIYSGAEILQLSVKEIVNPQTFDLLQNPVVGGLHDASMGPSRRDELCDTCGQSEKNCPGHFGHIRLPVLVYNPLLFKTLVQIMRGTCIACHKINMPILLTKVFTYQLTLIEKGFLAEAQVLVDRFRNSDGTTSAVMAEMKTYVKDVLKSAKKDEKDATKNTLTEMSRAVSEIFQTFAKSSIVCCHCDTKNRILKAEFNRTIVGTLVEDRGNRKKAKSKQQKTGDDGGGDDGDKTSNETATDEVETVVGEGDVEMDGEGGEEEKQENLEDTLDLSGGVADLRDFVRSKHRRCILSPNMARDHMRLLWKMNKEFLKKLLPIFEKVKGAECPVDIFFLDVLPVPPTRFRPLNMMNDRKFEHPQTSNLANVLRESIALKELLAEYNKKMETAAGENVQGPAMPTTSEDLAVCLQKILSSWLRLQSYVNVVLDSDLDKLVKDKCSGVRQVLEKKEGLFRKHMMGKRVNFAARSVISPDPYIATSEIGMPVVFASKLTYPQKVTPWNVQQLREMVINGPNIYPGASSVINEDGSVVKLNPANLTQREAIAKQLLVPDKDTTESKTVCRHLINGDFLLLNRQPTLHRPSIQAHKARVLPEIKTLRMHYSNCKAYNADFDGDEMNAHFPQCELSRAEASTLACVDQQYLVPKDGTPLAGLIQDHMVAGVGITIRGRFFNRRDYCGLVWSAMNDFRAKIDILPPAILKPQPLWSGKQVVSTILLNITPKGKAPINLKGKAKIPEKSWMSETHQRRILPLEKAAMEALDMGESTVVIRQGELLQGVLDKAHYGQTSYGLVHCCYELYGGEVAGLLLTYLGRLFTSFLQKCGFSLGCGDIMVKRKANKKRRAIIKQSQHVGKSAVVKALGISDGDVSESDLLLHLKNAHFDKTGFKMAEVDLNMKEETDKVQDGIAKAVMPGLEKSFPDNSLQLMVQAGAKGSPVNCMQISCLLGQIELEGRRPPLMLSGRSLPSFLPYDVSPKAGGFVTGRFLTGIRPQEYFFHCMAGREGLIDTAVKTSRSGYLQRCLVKHLEGLLVNYDLTVRDSDGSLVQFYYGEDGVEPLKNSFLRPELFPFLTENLQVLASMTKQDPWTNEKAGNKAVRHLWKKISKWNSHHREQGKWMNRETSFTDFANSPDAPQITEEDKTKIVTQGKCLGRTVAAQKLCAAWNELSEESKEAFSQKKVCPDPVMSKFLPHSQLDVMAEKFHHLLNVFCKKGFAKVMANKNMDFSPDFFKSVVNKKVVQAMAQPGEAVGLVCAQSIGEPSTQMTLNTFHFAGRGEMNVTLGIPRLREILMLASGRIKTPSMDIPVQMIPDARQQAEHFQRHLNRITLDKVLRSIHVKITTKQESFLEKTKNYKFIETKFKVLPKRDLAEFTNVTPRAIIRFIVRRFIPNFDLAVKKERLSLLKTTLLSSGKQRRSPGAQAEDEKEDNGSQDTGDTINNDDGDMEADPNDGDASAVKEQQRQLDTQEYEGEEEEMKEVEAEVGEDDDDDATSRATPEASGSKDEEEKSEDDDDNSDEEAMSNIEKLSAEDKNLLKDAKDYQIVENFTFDEKKCRWCTVVFKYEQSALQLDVKMLLEKNVKQTVVHRVKGITKAFLSEENEDGNTVLHIKTEGVNIEEMFRYPNILDLNRVYTNCVHTMSRVYGVEAANRVLIKEIQKVFGAYGIIVDYRHLSLLADYMTVRGQYDPFNRRGIAGNSSPLQKMTFETTMTFLLNACISGETEHLDSPSARIVAGKVLGVGTGCFDILDPL